MASGVKFVGVSHNIDDERNVQKDADDEILLDDDFDVDIDDFKPETKSRNFEFTDNLGLMRLLRVILFLQFIGIILDNPQVKTPMFFNIFCTHAFKYLIVFYSRPFADVCRIVEIFSSLILKTFNDVISNYQSSNNRRLTSLNSILEIEMHIDFLDPQSWHAVLCYARFFLGGFFFSMVILLIFRLWEITDYTDRKSVRKFMHEYVNAGWWMRGGVHVALIMARATIVGAIFLLLLFYIVKLFLFEIPEPRLVGAVVWMSASVIGFIWLLGYICIRAVERTFMRYVSQNKNYTSSIILKRVIKSKVELALVVLFLLFTPVLYVFTQSIIPMTDWNDALAFMHRRDVNYFVPCYFVAFPPYRKPMTADSCPVAQYTSVTQPFRIGGFFHDKSILQCDTYMGYIIYTLGLTGAIFVVAVTFWLVYRLIGLNNDEFRSSRWFNTVEAIWAKAEALQTEYEEDFKWKDRIRLATRLELKKQQKYYHEAVHYIYAVFYSIGKALGISILSPLLCMAQPLTFCAHRVLLMCNCLSRHGDEDRSSGSHRSHNHSHSRMSPKSKKSPQHPHSPSHRQSQPQSQSQSQGGAKPPGHLSTLRNNMSSRSGRVLGYIRSGGASVGSFITLATNKLRGLDSTGGDPDNKCAPDPNDRKVGLWRDDLTLISREREVQRHRKKLIQEYMIGKMEFVTDHTLAITVFDTVIDTAGTFAIVCQFRIEHFHWFLIILSEMTLYAITSSALNYYLLWQERAAFLMVLSITYGLVTYIKDPFTENADKWIDWLGRLLIVVIVLGQIICAAIAYDIEFFQEATPTITTLVSDSAQSAGAMGLYVIIDIIMVLAVYVYVIGVVHYIGVFDTMQRMIRNIQYSMHDHVLDVLVDIARERVFGFENLNTGLSVIQQWDDIIRQQRRTALIAWPDVRPSNLMSVRHKLIEIKWASIFNLTIENLRSSLGLTLLHTMMCSASSEVVRWLVYTHPDMLFIEDAQRDTPVSIALKECAHFLLLFSKFNKGKLEDLTSYADDEFDAVYPEVASMRKAFLGKGEFVTECAEVHILNPKESNELKSTGKFKLFKKHPEFPLGKKKPIFSRNRFFLTKKEPKNPSAIVPSQQQTANSRSKGKSELKGVALEKKRYPEDYYYEDFEGGQLSSWNVLGITVPDNNIDLEDYGNKNAAIATSPSDASVGGGGDEGDLRIAAGGMGHYHKVRTEREFQWEDMSYENGAGWGDAKDEMIADNRTSKVKEKWYTRMRQYIRLPQREQLQHQQQADDVSMTREKFDAVDGTEEEIRWKICRFAELLTSYEVSQRGNNMKWNTLAYKEFNKSATKMLGILAQHLAVCMNFNPPEGFTRFADWSLGDGDDFEGADRHIADEEGDHDNNNDNESHLLSPSIVTKGLSGLGKVFQRLRGSALPKDAFNDRIIQFLSELLVSSRCILDLSDCQLSGPARVAWRAICRALRRKFCSFIIPSLFISPKAITITHIYLQNNELDCGDAVLIADVIKEQQTLITLDLSRNRIGARGLATISKPIKSHLNLTVFRINHNRIGPAAAKDIGLMLKRTKTLKVFSISHNRLGELVRYPNHLTREHIRSATRDIFTGLRSNRTIQILDISYNHLGPRCAEYVPLAVMRHLQLKSLNISGNDIGAVHGPRLLWRLAGKIEEEKVEGDDPENRSDGGSTDRTTARSNLTSRSSMGASETGRSGMSIGNKSARSARSGRSGRSGMSIVTLADGGKPAAKLVELCLTDNQLGPMSGVALGTLVRRTSSLTALDVSDNSLGPKGARGILNSLMEVFGIGGFNSRRCYPPMLIHLNMARNGLGTEALSSLAEILELPHCTLATVDMSGNPLGRSPASAGVLGKAIAKIREGLGKNTSLERFDVSNASLIPTQLLPLFGAVASNRYLKRISFKNMPFDEPCCLMLAKAMQSSPTLEILEVPGANMCPKGGGFMCMYLERVKDRIKHFDISGSHVGGVAIRPVARAIRDSRCVLHTLLLADNDLGAVGGKLIASAIMKNKTLTSIDLSGNNLTAGVAEQMADDYKVLITSGQDNNIRRIIFSDNPLIGSSGAQAIVRSFSSEHVEYIAIANIGAGPRTAFAIGKALRNVTVAWKYLDISRNKLSRVGLNELLWALRRNRRVKVLKLGYNGAGLIFGSQQDVLGEHGIALPRAIQENLTLRELDLSGNGICSSAANNIFVAMKTNMCIQRLCLRGNIIDDDSAAELAELLLNNDVLQDLDLGDNRLSYEACYAVAEGLEKNRSLRILCMDKNTLGSAGPTTMEAFWRGLCMNFSLRILNLDENRLGTDWCIKLADAFARNCSLIQVTLRNNRLDPRGGEALLRSYKANNHLSDLMVTEDEVGADIYREMQEIFFKKRAKENAEVEDGEAFQDMLIGRQRAMMFEEY
eukprot:gene898-1738_t